MINKIPEIVRLQNIISKLEEENTILINNSLTSNINNKDTNIFKKISAKPADHGFRSMWLNKDWQGADFIATHINDDKTLKILLKNNFSLNKKYIDQNIHICFIHENNIYLYPHDLILQQIENNHNNKITIKENQYISSNIFQNNILLLDQYKL